MFKVIEKLDINNPSFDEVIDELVELSPNYDMYLKSLMPKDNFLKGRDPQQKLQVVKTLMNDPAQKMNAKMMLGVLPEEYFYSI